MAKIDVVFNDSSNETAGTTQPTQKVADSTNKAGSYVIGQAVVQLGKRALNYGANMVGNITGNYLLQSKIDNSIMIVNYGSQIGVGFATGGVVGGIASTIAVAGQIAMNEISYEIERSKSNTQARFLASTRGGILNNGSR